MTLFLHRTHLYPTLFPVPPRAFLLPPFFRRETKDERTTAAADTSSSFRAGPHHGLRRKAASTALELFPGITTYLERWKEDRAERVGTKLESSRGHSWNLLHRAEFCRSLPLVCVVASVSKHHHPHAGTLKRTFKTGPGKRTQRMCHWYTAGDTTCAKPSDNNR